MKASPATSAGVSDPVVKLLRVIMKDPPVLGAVVDFRAGGQPPLGLHELI